MASVIAHAVAVGMVAAGGSWDKKAARSARRGYDQMLQGFVARAMGHVGKTHDAYGHPIAHSLGEVRSWLVEAKVIKE